MNVYEGRLLEKPSNRKSKLVLSSLVTAWLSNITFHLRPFGCKLWLLSIQNYAWRRFQAFACSHLKSLRCSIQIWADALSSDRSSIQTCFFAQDSILNMLFCSYVIFLLRDEWMIERFSEAMGAALVSNTILFHMKGKSDSSRPEIYKALKPYWLLNWVSITRVVACFPQASLLQPAATAADSETPCVCARPSNPHKQSRRAAPRAWPLIFPSKPSITF